MEKGWHASGRLTPIYKRLGGVDKVASLTGISRQTLSGYNTGARRLGEKNARRIAIATGVTLEELGAPPGAAGAQAPILVRLADLEALCDAQGETIAENRKAIRLLQAQAQRLGRELRQVHEALAQEASQG